LPREQGDSPGDVGRGRWRRGLVRRGKPDMLRAMVPILLIRVAIALVWLYEGVWCKLLNRMPHQVEVVAAHPMFSERSALLVLRAIGLLEVLLALWVLSGWEPVWAALTQTVILAGMNANGVLFSREHIHDPAGMVIKNFAFVVLMWVGAFHGG